MSPTLYYSAIMLGVMSLVLCIIVVCYGQSDQGLESEAQAGQNAINHANTLQQAETNIVRDMAVASVNDEAMKTVLAKNWLAVTVNDSSAKPTQPAPAASGSKQP